MAKGGTNIFLKIKIDGPPQPKEKKDGGVSTTLVRELKGIKKQIASMPKKAEVRTITKIKEKKVRVPVRERTSGKLSQALRNLSKQIEDLPHTAHSGGG